MKHDINIIAQKNFDEESLMNFVIFIQQKSERLYRESLKSFQEKVAVFTSLSTSLFLKFRQSLNEIITKITFNFIVDNIQVLYQSQAILKP